MIDIRTATEADLNSVLGIYSQDDFDNGVVLDATKAIEIWKRFSDYPNYKLWVAESESEIVGTFALLIMENLAHLGAPSAIVEDVVVHALHQGRGIGKIMMQFAIEEAARWGCYKLSLSSSLKRDAAHKFYESLGFQKHGYSYDIRITD
jgi:GNAT superfamily N-acetyltransferase